MGAVGVDVMESDDSLRERVCYVADRQPLPGGAALDRIAESYGLKRRKVEDTTQPIKRYILSDW